MKRVYIGNYYLFIWIINTILWLTGFADIYIVFLPCGEEVRQGAEGGAAGGAGTRGGDGGKEGGPTGLEVVDGKTDGISAGRRSVKKASLVEEFL